MKDEDLERLLLARSPQFQALLNQSRQSIEQGKGLSRDEFCKTVKSRGREAESKRSPRRKRLEDRKHAIKPTRR